MTLVMVLNSVIITIVVGPKICFLTVKAGYGGSPI